MEKRGISKYKFYKKTGLSNGFLDKSENIGSDKCEIIIAHYPDLNLEWLITGKGNMLKNTLQRIGEDSPETSDPNELVSILKKLVESQDQLIESQRNRIDDLEYKNSWLEKERTNVKSGEVPK